MSFIITFISGFLIECSCVFWVHYSERKMPLKTAFFSMIVGASQILGIGESIKDPISSITFIIGYGVGTYVTVKFIKDKTDKKLEIN